MPRQYFKISHHNSFLPVLSIPHCYTVYKQLNVRQLTLWCRQTMTAVGSTTRSALCTLPNCRADPFLCIAFHLYVYRTARTTFPSTQNKTGLCQWLSSVYGKRTRTHSHYRTAHGTVPHPHTNKHCYSAHTAVFMCFVWISEQTAIISLYNIN
jgi:hypothetical protein